MLTVCNKFKVSIIVPIYNVEPYLAQCVESLMGQTLRNIEIVLVNDGSSDGCREICDFYASKDGRVKVIHKSNDGLINARKAGLKLSTGEYVAYVDGDDWVEPEMYENLLANAAQHDADMVIGGHKEDLLWHVETLLNSVPSDVYQSQQLEEVLYPIMLNNVKFSHFGIYSYVWGKLFRRSLLYPKQMQVDERIFIGEDAAVVYPCLLDSNVVCVLDSALYHYRQRADSLIKTPTRTEISKAIVLYNYLKERFLKSGHGEILIPQLQSFILSLLTVRADGLPADSFMNNVLYAFRGVKPGSRIVLCGAGTFGQHLYKRLKSSPYYNLICWIDELWYEYRCLGLDVTDIYSIGDVSYDHVVIAFIDEDIAENIENKLIGIGVPAKKIAKVSHYKEDTEDILRQFGLET